MRCERCQRPLNKPAWSIQTRAGRLNYGPKCARMAGLLEPEKRTKAPKPARTTEEEAQLALDLEFAA
jgi:hypothetical protein